jgi:hypothetical protein
MSLRESAATIHAAIVEVDRFAMYPAIRGTWLQSAVRDVLLNKGCGLPRSCLGLHPRARHEVGLRPVSMYVVEPFDEKQ